MKFIKALLLVILLLLALAALAIFLFPASTAISWMGGRLGPVQLEEVGGTIWDGHAGRATAFGEDLGRLRWTASPISALRAAPRVNLELEGERYQGSTLAVLHGALSMDLADAKFRFPAEKLRPALDVPGLVPTGTVEVDLPSANIVGGYPRSLRGEAIWRDAAVAGEAAAALGDIKAEFRTTADGAITGVISDLGGPLKVEGSFRFALTGYEAEALLTPRGSNLALDKALNHIGERQPDGSAYLTITGSMLPIR
ncbi:type II secretion system protein N [Pseudomarimonas salicorniae]|uniref:Type II secretion system protein N n=1 Tax=Pseudomarimonas salicorniae TaxID=2933270 RepID=A0ABT0GF37_9GAMM|nr:type II secretion system protein N [Lysobacter sp. CAU 1642]MCK7592784.1 type II secretion system protein N [Lysobacter sp. CAU 1642]